VQVPRPRRAGLLAAVLLALVVALGGSGATAQPAGPPDPGPIFLSDALTSPGFATPAWCPSSMGSRERAPRTTSRRPRSGSATWPSRESSARA